MALMSSGRIRKKLKPDYCINVVGSIEKRDIEDLMPIKGRGALEDLLFLFPAL